MKTLLTTWQTWAALSAIFAALTTIFAKIGIENISSDFATFIRTCIILIITGALIFFTRQYQPLNSISPKSFLFLVLSGLATGASWICYFRALKIGNASQVAPIDKFSLVLVAVFGVIFLGEQVTVNQWLGIGFVALGVIVLALQ
ncbi:MAG: EamA family transporter [Anaerolineales bacterium]|nr:EamA family transporter [Anaerolineales bacterium]